MSHIKKYFLDFLKFKKGGFGIWGFPPNFKKLYAKIEYFISFSWKILSKKNL